METHDEVSATEEEDAAAVASASTAVTYIADIIFKVNCGWKGALHFSQVFPSSHGSGRCISPLDARWRGVAVHAHLSGDSRRLTGVTSAVSIG